MTFSVWFDGDETLWDRRGYMLTGLLDEPSHVDDVTRAPELFPDVLPAMVDLAERGSVNLINYAPMPAGHEHVLPPFAAHVDAPGAPSDLPPELHDTEADLNWLATFERIDAVIAESGSAPDDVVLISNTVGPFAKAAERGWLTVWLNRDRVANLSESMPSAEIHSLLDLPEALDAIDEARAIIAGLMPSSEATLATALDGVTPA